MGIKRVVFDRNEKVINNSKGLSIIDYGFNCVEGQVSDFIFIMINRHYYNVSFDYKLNCNIKLRNEKGEIVDERNLPKITSLGMISKEIESIQNDNNLDNVENITLMLHVISTISKEIAISNDTKPFMFRRSNNALIIKKLSNGDCVIKNATDTNSIIVEYDGMSILINKECSGESYNRVKEILNDNGVSLVDMIDIRNSIIELLK